MISNNVATAGGGGGVSFNPTLEDCLVISNRCYGEYGSGGGITAYSGHAVRTSFIGNRSLKTSPTQKDYIGSGGGASGITAENCRFIGNLTEGAGGGAVNSTLIDCIVQDNIASNNANWGLGSGGGISDCNATNCLIIGNKALSVGVKSAGYGCGGGVDNSAKHAIVQCVVSNNVADSRGGGVHYGSTYNCLIPDNICHGEGGGVFGGSHYNALITGNTSADGGGAAGWGALLVNCTIAGNRGQNDLNYTVLINTVAMGDGKGATAWIKASTNSCAACLTDAHGPRNTTADPKLGTEGAMRYVPQPGSPCIDAGLFQPWMTDPNSPSVRDLNGRHRIIGPAVDIGAFEAPFWGTKLLLR